MKPMTNDTAKAMEVIVPMADILGIDVQADGHFLYCDGQAIGIGCNSAYATVCEFIAYAMLWLSKHEYRYNGTIKRDLDKALKRYWCTIDKVKMIRMADEIIELTFRENEEQEMASDEEH